MIPRYCIRRAKTWPADRIIAEAHLELNRFIEPHLITLQCVPRVTKRIVLGRIAEEIAEAAKTEQADLVIMSRRRRRKLYHWVSGSITDRVTRLCSCPVLSVTEPLPSGNWRPFHSQLFPLAAPGLGPVRLAKTKSLKVEPHQHAPLNHAGDSSCLEIMS
jgi:hypothetical protein